MCLMLLCMRLPTERIPYQETALGKGLAHDNFW